MERARARVNEKRLAILIEIIFGCSVPIWCGKQHRKKKKPYWKQIVISMYLAASLTFQLWSNVRRQRTCATRKDTLKRTIAAHSMGISYRTRATHTTSGQQLANYGEWGTTICHAFTLRQCHRENMRSKWKMHHLMLRKIRRKKFKELFAEYFTRTRAPYLSMAADLAGDYFGH